MVGVASGAVYQLLNTFFVARLGAAPTAAVVLMTPVMLSCTVVAQVFGVGVSSVAARCLGRGDARSASQVASASLLVGFAVSTCIALVAMALIPVGLSALLGAGPDVIGYMIEYAVPALLGQAAMSFCIISGFVVRLEGRNRLSMATQLVGFGCNALFDVVLIWILGLGVVGAGLGTLISQLAAAGVYLWSFQRRRATLAVGLVVPRWRAWVPALLTGAPTGLGLVLSNAVLAEILRASVTLSVEVASSVGIGLRVYTVACQLAVGFVLGAQGLLGYWIGKRAAGKTRSVIAWLVAYAFAVSCLISLAMSLFPAEISSVFSPAGSPNPRLGEVLRILALSVPGIGLVQVAITVFQSAGRLALTYILVLMRSGIFVPILFLLRGPGSSAPDIAWNLAANDITAGLFGALSIGASLLFVRWFIRSRLMVASDAES